MGRRDARRREQHMGKHNKWIWEVFGRGQEHSFLAPREEALLGLGATALGG